MVVFFSIQPDKLKSNELCGYEKSISSDTKLRYVTAKD